MTSTSKDLFSNNNIKKESVNGFKYTMENDHLSQELQFKMSKKIAQLTKVIYALNTRNDDHETLVAEIEMRHAEELAQVSRSLQQRVEAVDGRLRDLEEGNARLVESNRTSEAAINALRQENAAYKDSQAEEMTLKELEWLNSSERLRTEIGSLRRSYEALLRDQQELEASRSQQIGSQVEAERQRAEEVLQRLDEEWTAKEKQWSELLAGKKAERERECSEQERDAEIGRQRWEAREMELESRLVAERAAWEEQKRGDDKTQDDERVRLVEFELEEARAALKDLEGRAQQKQTGLKRDLEAMGTELQTRELLVVKTRDQLLVDQRLRQGLEIQLQQTKTQVNQERETVKGLETEVSRMCQSSAAASATLQAANKKSEKLQKELRDTRATLERIEEARLQEKEELIMLRERQRVAENERGQLVLCTKSVEVDYEIQIQSLTRGLEEMEKERSALKVDAERQRGRLELEAAQRLAQLQRQSEQEMERLTRRWEKELEARNTAKMEEARVSHEESEIVLEDERKKSSKIIVKLKTELDQFRIYCNNKIKAKEKEAVTSAELAYHNDRESKSLATQLHTVRESLTVSKKACRFAEKAKTEKEEQLIQLQRQMENVRVELELHKSALKKMGESVKVEEDVSERCTRLAAELEKKWADTLRRETGRVRNEVLESARRETEVRLAAVRSEGAEAERDRLQTELEAERAQLREDVARYRHRQIQDDDDNTRRQAQLEAETQNLESRLASLRGEMEALANSREMEMRIEHEAQLVAQRKQADERCEALRMETTAVLQKTETAWKQRHETALADLMRDSKKTTRARLDELERSHSRQMQASLGQTESALRRESQTSEDNLNAEIQDLQNKSRLLQQQLATQASTHAAEMQRTSSAITTAKESNNQLQAELDKIELERATLRSQNVDTQHQLVAATRLSEDKLRARDTEATKERAAMIQRERQRQEEETRATLADFSRAQSLYQERLRDLQFSLVTAQCQLAERPSRDEDLEVQATLRAQLRCAEKEIERLNADERQRLVSQLHGQPANQSRRPSLDKTRPSLHGSTSKQRLSPLPGSPFHDEPLHPHKTPLSSSTTSPTSS